MAELFEPQPADATEKSEDTLIVGDIDDIEMTQSLPGVPEAPAETPLPAFEDKSLEETFDAHPLEEETIETGVTQPLAAEQTGTVAFDEEEKESTAVFQDFSSDMVPHAPPPPPEVELFVSTQSGLPGQAIDKKDKPYDIPDHVLTPTLADLYFQQGQAQLSLSMYERLLQKDGANQKFKDIKKVIASGVAPAPLQPPAPLATAKPAKRPVESGKPRTRPASGDDKRPLAGVRIKKRPKKLNWRKRSEK
jgi:hypothetical protein